MNKILHYLILTWVIHCA